MKIGFFDSGLGGLTILRAVAATLPHYDYEYYGDTANVPYGNRSEADIFALTKHCVLELFERNCALVIIACNTASAETLRALQDSVLTGVFESRRILGVIIPTVETIAALPQAKRATLIATKRTVESNKYKRELEKLTSSIELASIATPELVPLIEANQIEEATEVAVGYLEASADTSVSEVIVLGCTHYTELKEKLRERYQRKGKIVISQDEVIPAKLGDYLARHPEIESLLTKGSTRNIYLSENRNDYDRITATLLRGVVL